MKTLDYKGTTERDSSKKRYADSVADYQSNRMSCKHQQALSEEKCVNCHISKQDSSSQFQHNSRKQQHDRSHSTPVNQIAGVRAQEQAKPPVQVYNDPSDNSKTMNHYCQSGSKDANLKLIPETICSSQVPSLVISPRGQEDNNHQSKQFTRSISTPVIVPAAKYNAGAPSQQTYQQTQETNRTNNTNSRFDDKGSALVSSRMLRNFEKFKQDTMQENTAKITPTGNSKAGKIIHKERKASGTQ